MESVAGQSQIVSWTVVEYGALVAMLAIGVLGTHLAVHRRRRGHLRKHRVWPAIAIAFVGMVIGVAAVRAFFVGVPFESRVVRYEDPDQNGSRVTVSMAVTRDEAAPPTTLLEPDPPRMLPAASVWAEKASEVLRADVYPCPEQAAEAAAVDAVTKVLKAGSLQAIPPLVARVYGEAPSEVLIAVVDRIQRAYPAWNVYVRASPAAQHVRSKQMPDRGVDIGVEIERTGSEEVAPRENAGLRAITTENRGVARVVARRGQTQHSSTAKFIGKAWAHDLASFTSSSPDRSWMVAPSLMPYPTQTQAVHAAQDEAARRLLPKVRERLAESRNNWLLRLRGGRPRWSLSDDREQDILRVELMRGAYIVDKFVQSFDRPYGTTWHAQLLIDSSDVNLDRLARAIANERAKQHRSWTTHLISVGGLLALVCGLYVFLNAATKGYYAWSLRVVVVLAVLGGIGLVVA